MSSFFRGHKSQTFLRMFFSVSIYEIYCNICFLRLFPHFSEGNIFSWLSYIYMCQVHKENLQPICQFSKYSKSNFKNCLLRDPSYFPHLLQYCNHFISDTPIAMGKEKKDGIAFSSYYLITDWHNISLNFPKLKWRISI